MGGFELVAIYPFSAYIANRCSIVFPKTPAQNVSSQSLATAD